MVMAGVKKSKPKHTGTFQTSGCIPSTNVQLAKVNPMISLKIRGRYILPIMRTKQDCRCIIPLWRKEVGGQIIKSVLEGLNYSNSSIVFPADLENRKQHYQQEFLPAQFW